MRILRDPQGRFFNIGKIIEIPTNFYRGCNNSTTNSIERYRKTPIESSSTLKPKETLSGYLTGEAIEGEGTLAGGPKDLISEEVQEDQPLETSNPPLVLNPNNTTFSLVRDPHFVDFVDPAQVKSIFGNSIDPVISQIETSIVEPTIPIGFNKT